MTKKINLATRDELLNLKKQVKKLEEALKEKDSQG
jgi:BMFP domain-containing protein YqiC